MRIFYGPVSSISCLNKFAWIGGREFENSLNILQALPVHVYLDFGGLRNCILRLPKSKPVYSNMVHVINAISMRTCGHCYLFIGAKQSVKRNSSEIERTYKFESSRLCLMGNDTTLTPLTLAYGVFCFPTESKYHHGTRLSDS